MEYRIYLTFLPKLRCLGWFKTSQALHREENKVEFLEWQFHNEKLSFFHKKETEHSFKPFLSIFNPEMQNFGLENHHDHHENARQAFCWLMSLTKVSNPFLPLPRKKLQTYAFKIDRFWSVSHFYSLLQQ